MDRAPRRVVFEDGGDGDLGVVERVLDQPPAALRAVDAALRLGVHHPPAGAGLEGQVDADAAQLAGLAAAAGGGWPRAAPSSRFRRRACVGLMARQGRCVVEAGVRGAASRAARKHAEALVCPPASFPWPPFRSVSLSPVSFSSPGHVRPRADSGRCAGPAGQWRVSRSGAVRRAACRSRQAEKAYRSPMSVSALDTRSPGERTG